MIGGSPLIVHRGGCHCGAVRFEVDAPAAIDVLECNCSICRATGYLHLILPRSRMRLLAGEGALREYKFNTGAARHFFCATCGIKSFYVPRSNPDGYSVNARCLDPASITVLTVRQFDDADREAAEARIRDLSKA